MKKTMGLMVCFNHSTDRKMLLNQMVSSDNLGFEPTHYIIDNQMAFESKSFLREVAWCESHRGIIVENENVNFHITYPAKENAPLALTWKFSEDHLDTTIVEHFFSMPGFVCAYLYDYWDVFWQSETTISGYEIHQRDYSRLRMTLDKWDRKIIDVSKNYGRQTLLQDLWLMAAPEMWLGEMYFKLVCSKSRLLEYPSATELTTGIVHVELLNEWLQIEEKDVKLLRSEQEKFRTFINTPEIENKLS